MPRIKKDSPAKILPEQNLGGQIKTEEKEDIKSSAVEIVLPDQAALNGEEIGEEEISKEIAKTIKEAAPDCVFLQTK